MSRRLPAAPPLIDGFDNPTLLGTGGFSDVYLYEQRRPRRRVAVKVLLHDITSEDARERFDSEADLMAQLSTHPSIVTIYEAGVAADGRPYLAMEYCSRPSLGATYRRNPVSVAEALRVGIQVAGAVETAHRAGILHRDIKPANILVTEYNRPALTDFGISATTGSPDADAEGMSIPWSPPESFAEPPRSGIGTDVWALAATVYTLLAGRSPFEVPGGRNSGADLIARIERTPLAPTGRTDVPSSLERVLATAMAKSPEARYPSALALARAFQQVQIEVSLAPTSVDVLEDVVAAGVDEDDDDPGTRIRQVVSIDPLGGTGGTGRTDPRTSDTRSGSQDVAEPGVSATVPGLVARDPGVPVIGPVPLAPAVDEHTVMRSASTSAPVPRRVAIPTAPVLEHTVPRPGQDAPEQDAGAPTVASATRSWWKLLVGVGAVVAIGIVAAVALAGGDTSTTGPGPDPAASAEPLDPIVAHVAAPTGLAGVVSGDGVTFTWSNPAPSDGDTYLWRIVTALDKGELAQVATPTATVPSAAGSSVCVEVVVRRSTGLTSAPAKACAP